MYLHLYPYLFDLWGEVGVLITVSDKGTEEQVASLFLFGAAWSYFYLLIDWLDCKGDTFALSFYLGQTSAFPLWAQGHSSVSVKQNLQTTFAALEPVCGARGGCGTCPVQPPFIQQEAKALGR